MPPRTFRFLLCATLVLGLSGLMLDAVIPNTTVANLSYCVPGALTGSPSMRVAGALLALVSYVCQVTAVVGLWTFRRWGIPLALAGIVLSAGAGPLVGYSLMSGDAMALVDLTNVLWGAILAVACYSPVRRHFAKHRQALPRLCNPASRRSPPTG